MRKILLLLLLIVPVVAMSKKRDDSKYLVGAVPQDANGIVVFKQRFSVPGKSKDYIFNTLKQWAEGLAEHAIHDLRTRQVDANQSEGLIVYRIEEWMIFKKVFLNLDRTRFRYQLSVICTDQAAEIRITQISYYYGEETDGNKGKTYVAEDWITDKYALNKKRTKLYPFSGKFRRKTVDRAEELFSLARDMFESQEEVIQQEKHKATRILQ